MKSARVAGVFLGLVTLAATFLLPFTDLVNGSEGFMSLYSAFDFFLHNVSTLEQAKNNGILILTFVYLIAFVVIILSGIAGAVPLGAGILGVVGIASITAAPYVAYTDYAFSADQYGAGFYLIWAATLGCLVVAVVDWRTSKKAS